MLNNFALKIYFFSTNPKVLKTQITKHQLITQKLLILTR